MKKTSFLFLFFPLFLFGQESDFKLWSKLSIDYALNKKSNFSITQGYRWRENASLKDETFTNLAFSQKINKRIRFSLGYRFIVDYDMLFNPYYSNRLNADFRWRKKYDRITLKNRLRFQYIDHLVLRDRLSVEYNVPKTPFTPYSSFEYYVNSGRDKYRLTVGATYPIFDDLTLNTYYRLQTPIAKKENTHILGIGFNYRYD